MKADLRIAIVIPALNEEATIAQVVARASAYGKVVVVDDGSRDRTASLATGAGAQVVHHPRNQGYEAALESGFREAARLGFEAVVTLDADGQHHPELIGRYADLLREGYELVLGVRAAPPRLAERIFAVYARARYGVRDPLCGMKGYDLELYRSLGHFDDCHSVGTELALLSVSAGRRFIQVDIPISERRMGTPRFGSLLKANWRVLRALGAVVLKDLPGAGERPT
jgi:glycosyltransferase involved in cell wall biosynthesis